MENSTVTRQTGSLESYFEPFRNKIVGIDQTIRTPYGTKPLVYADWIASGRLYQPIEDRMLYDIGPMVGNTHTESSETGQAMTHAYHHAHELIKQHLHTDESDVIITTGSGMTGAVAKLIRILGLRLPEKMEDRLDLSDEERPVVFVTHMEHHSNQIPWQESMADVVVVDGDDDLLVNPENLRRELAAYEDRPLKIGAFTACSNVTGIETPYHELAKIMHDHGGVCFVDFAANAPYADIDMHPEGCPESSLDAIFFSPHKFLGGPGSSGVLVFNRKLYHNEVPDTPGGGTVTWTNPWGGRSYFDDVELREDGGTPGFLQAIRAALSIRLKEAMEVDKIRKREEELLDMAFERFDQIDDLHILADNTRERIGIISFYVDDLHYNLLVRLLNDRYGIQVRGGCSCAGTYGHYLLHVDPDTSHKITDKIDHGDFSEKPGWVRLSLHPTMTDAELEYILNAIEEIVEHSDAWGEEYEYNSSTNEFVHLDSDQPQDVAAWFSLDLPEGGS